MPESVFQAMEDMLTYPHSMDDLVDYVLTAGDNLYPDSAHHPRDDEFEQILNHFRKPNLKNIPVYAVRGNHDCEFDWKREIFLNETYD